jgi:hypothetical protein
MPRQATAYTIVIASPGDTETERKALAEVVHAWNATNSVTTGIVLLPVSWEIHSTPDVGPGQAIRDADMLVGIFWTRLGAPTGEAESRTIDEIDRFRKAGKHVVLYFSDAPAIPGKVNRERYERLEDYRARCQRDGSVDRYDSVTELREKFDGYLTSLARELRGGHEKPIEDPLAKARVAAADENAQRTAPDRIIELPRAVTPPPAPPPPSPPPPVRPPRPVLTPMPSAGAHGGADVTSDLRAAGWRGVLVGKDFYAWAGPSLNDLPDRDPVEMPNELDPELKKALDDVGALPSWQSKRTPLTFRDEQRLFITDRKTFKRAISCGKDNVLFVRPAE